MQIEIGRIRYSSSRRLWYRLLAIIAVNRRNAEVMKYRFIGRVAPSMLLISSMLVSTGHALAQDQPAGLLNEAPATEGATDVAQEGFQTAAKPEVPPEESPDTTTLTISAGGLLASGNSRAISATTAGNFKFRRQIHQLTAAVATNFGRSAASRDAEMETTVENYQGRVRYDLFFTKRLAGFFQTSLRRDRFQGLDLRLNIDPGLAYYFVDQKQRQFWAELGYDLQHDIRREEARVNADTGAIADKTATRHNARAFVGFDHQMNKAVTFATGLEYLQGLSPYEDDDTHRVNWRLNWDAGLTSKVGDGFSVATTVTVKYDNNPLPGLAKTDTITAVNLVYSLF
jgi:putative salt-induced outer membrane protein YdiY